MDFVRESIFSSSIRAFLKWFFGTLGTVVGMIVIFILGSTLFFQPADSPLLFKPQIVLNGKGNLSHFQQISTLLKINIHGVIGDEISSSYFDRLLYEAEKSIFPQQVKGILISFSTPGGTVTDSFNIYQSLKQWKESKNIPVYGFIDGMNCSGGLYISSVCDKIFATPPSLVGSLGVRMGPFFNFSSLLKQYGISVATLSTKNKVHLDPFTPWKPEEEKIYDPILNSFYEQFLQAVVQGRTPEGMSQEQYSQELRNIGAAVFDAATGVRYGYVDEPNASYFTAIQALADHLTLENYQVIQMELIHTYPSFLSGISSLFQDRVIKHEHYLGSSSLERLSKERYFYLCDGF